MFTNMLILLDCQWYTYFWKSLTDQSVLLAIRNIFLSLNINRFELCCYWSGVIWQYYLFLEMFGIHSIILLVRVGVYMLLLFIVFVSLFLSWFMVVVIYCFCCCCCCFLWVDNGISGELRVFVWFHDAVVISLVFPINVVLYYIIQRLSFNQANL